jgi:hypothetical protein
MAEHRVTLGGKADAAQLLREIGEVRHLDAADVLEAAGIVGVAADAIGGPTNLPRDGADVRAKPLPLGRNALVRLEGVASAKAGNEQCSTVLQAGSFQFHKKGLIHSDWLHEFKAGEMAPSPDTFGGEAELMAEGSGESLMGAVPGIESNGENIRGSQGKRPGRFAQATAAEIAYD